MNALKGTALHWARSKEDITQLCTYRAKMEKKSFTGDRPIHIMIQKKRTEAAYQLILQGAEINRRGQGGNTPLHFAANLGDTHTVKMLILFGADFNKKNSQGKYISIIYIVYII